MKKPQVLTFKDLTKFDIELLKNISVDKHIHNKSESAATELIDTVFDMIRAKGYDVVLTEREPTWSQPRESWHTPAPRQYNWWKDSK